MIAYSRLKLYYVCRVSRNEKDRKISEFPLNAHHRLLASSPSPSKNRFTREKSNWRADSQAAGGRRRFVKAIKGSRREKKSGKIRNTKWKNTWRRWKEHPLSRAYIKPRRWHMCQPRTPPKPKTRLCFEGMKPFYEQKNTERKLKHPTHHLRVST